MNPCPHHRETVALLACGALAAGDAAELDRHLPVCAGCRDYLRQLTAVCDKHARAAQELPEATVSMRLHGRIAAAISIAKDRGRPESDSIGVPGWRRLASASVVILVLLAGWFWVRQSAMPSRLVSAPVGPPLERPTSSAESIPLITYRLALNRSPEELDELLTREAIRRAPEPGPVLRSSLARLDTDRFGLGRDDSSGNVTGASRWPGRGRRSGFRW